MRPNVPVEQQVDAHALKADGRVYLYEVELVGGGFIRVRNGPDVTWNGMNFENLGVSVTGKGQSTGEEVFRPKMQIVNPEGIFSSYIASGSLERAYVREYAVLRTHLDNDQPIYTMRLWTIGKIVSLNHHLMVAELRELGDGPNFTIPGRVFMPPEFPQTSLQ